MMSLPPRRFRPLLALWPLLLVACDAKEVPLEAMANLKFPITVSALQDIRLRCPPERCEEEFVHCCLGDPHCSSKLDSDCYRPGSCCELVMAAQASGSPSADYLEGCYFPERLATYPHDICAPPEGCCSPQDGESVSVGPGVVTAVNRDGHFWLQDPDTDESLADPEGRQYKGVFVFNKTAAHVFVGDVVYADGELEEFYDVTEISASGVEVVGRSSVVPAEVEAFAVVTPCIVAVDADEDGFPCKRSQGGVDEWRGSLAEAYEGVLVQAKQVQFEDYASFGEVVLSQGLHIDDDLYSYSPGAGDRPRFHSITGILDYAWDFYKILPRSSEDIVLGCAHDEDCAVTCVNSTHCPEGQQCRDGFCDGGTCRNDVCVCPEDNRSDHCPRRFTCHLPAGVPEGVCVAPPCSPMSGTFTLYEVLNELDPRYPCVGGVVTIHEVVVTSDIIRDDGDDCVQCEGVCPSCYDSFFVAEPEGGAFSGIQVTFTRDPAIDVHRGDVVEVTGVTSIYYGMPQIMISNLKTMCDATEKRCTVSRGDCPSTQECPRPAVVSPEEIQSIEESDDLFVHGPLARDYLGVVVEVRDVELTDVYHGSSYDSFTVGENLRGGDLFCPGDLFETLVEGQAYNRIAGILYFGWGEYRLEPRDEDDIE